MGKNCNKWCVNWDSNQVLFEPGSNKQKQGKLIKIIYYFYNQINKHCKNIYRVLECWITSHALKEQKKSIARSVTGIERTKERALHAHARFQWSVGIYFVILWSSSHRPVVGGSFNPSRSIVPEFNSLVWHSHRRSAAVRIPLGVLHHRLWWSCEHHN